MSAATKRSVKKNLQELVPLNALSDTSFTEIARKIVIEEVRSGYYLFRKGDRDNQSVYLLDGKIDLIDGHKKVTGEVAAGNDISRYPLANQQPRPLSARAATKVVIARIDTTLLDAFLNWDHSSVAEVTEIKADNNEDWMTRILQSDAFSRIPPAIIQRLIISMQPFPVRAGEVVIRQGDEGDFFYSIHKGRCAVTRRASPDGAEELLSELLAGDFFGEESLVSATTRNASITMLTDGLLMRLAKKEFVELLQKPLVHSIGYEQAAAMVDEGAVWIDVRSAAEYESNAFEDSVNIPMSELRDQIPELVFNAKYIICCDTGHRSTSAAFILSHKGFEVYVLDGGLNGLVSDAGAHPVPTRRYDGNAPRSANIIACNQNGKGETQDDGVASPESGMSGMVAEPHSAERLGELEALRCEVAALRQARPVNQETGREVAEHKAQFGRLQDAIADSNRQLSELNSQLETETKEKHWLREQYAIAQKDFSEQLIRLERELDLSRTLVDSLQAKTAAEEQEKQQLRTQLEAVQADRKTQLASIEDELARSTRRVDILQAEFAATKEHAVQLERDSESFHLEQCELAEKLRGELAQSRQYVETLQAELASVLQIRCESDTALQEQLRTVEALRMELAGSRQQLAVLEVEAVATREQKQTLIDGANVELAQRHEELERLRDELARAQQLSSELVGRIENGEDKTRDLQRQAEELRARFDAALAEKQELGRKLESLQQDNEARRGDSSLLESRHKEQLELVERLTADKQTAEDALARLRNEWNVERDALQDEIGQSRGQLADLLSRLEQSGENSGRENLHLQEELQSRVNAYQERLEKQEHRHAVLQQEHAVIADGIQMLEAERDSLKTRLDGLAQEKASQQQEIEKLNAQIDSLKIAADSVVQALNEKLENERQRADEAEIQSSEHLSRIEALRVELASQKENNTGLIVDVEMLQKQEVELREEMQLTEDRFRARDQDNQESLKKAYEDLARKNEIEREMQGQIERLRKKLEQSEESLQSARHDERESVENIRNELNAERRARAEERAQMAARQRELKEQLVSVASQHEVVLATQEGVVAQARDDAREEERTRLSQIIAMQQQTEQQLAALQDELRRAHEETTAAVRQEREGNEADLALAQRQKADADAALSQIETQLRQLMQERDAALAEQQAIREQLNALRAEVEVARGLINAERQGLAGDPIRLIAELKETRRNIEIAVRLRSEAEAQRDRTVAQLDELRHGRGAQVSTDARSPEDIGNSQQVTPTQSTRKGGAAGHSELNPTIAPSGSIAAGVPGNDAGRGWQGKMLGFGMVVLAALAFWFMHQTENPPTLKDSAVDGAVPAVAVRDIPAEAPVAVDIAPVKDTALTKPVSSPRTDRPAQQTPSAVNSPVVDKPHATRVAAVRSFQDELAGGGSGPVMVELTAANYLMGSAGNSLNFEERPQHPVDLPTYAIGKYEVRFSEYDRFAQATGRHLSYDEGWGRDDRPAINVSWKDAVAYTRWLSEQTGHEYRLPSESEWEFAARAGTTTAFWWDGKTNGSSANCFDCGSRWDGTSTAPVGSFPANSFGLYDTAGNVQEWAEDCYHSSYQDAPSDGSTWQASGCTQRVVRGGSYTSPLDSVRSAKRGQYDQDTRLDNLGFRVVRVK